MYCCFYTQPGTPVARPFDAPTPGSGWESTSGTGFGDAPFNAPTPSAQPMTPIPASYLPGTPGGQLMTPGNAGMDAMSPMIGLPLPFHLQLGWD